MKEVLPVADWADEFAYVCGFRELYRVEGDSMHPALSDGDLILVNPYAEFRVGDIVVARHPFQKDGEIIKRVREITPEGAYFLVGDNRPESTDSRSFGAIPAKDILGKAEAKVK
jgi:nickel-type superoxide dismutase maturation protease